MFISGCAENMAQFFHLIDIVILLSAPVATIMERLAARSIDGYGHIAQEREKVAELTAAVEPLLRQSADYEIDTRKAIHATVDEVLQLARRAG